MNRHVVLSVDFRRWKRRHPWTCRRCGAAVVETNVHARWHAHIEDGTRLVVDCGTWAEGGHEMTVHVGSDGWQL